MDWMWEKLINFGFETAGCISWNGNIGLEHATFLWATMWTWGSKEKTGNTYRGVLSLQTIYSHGNGWDHEGNAQCQEHPCTAASAHSRGTQRATSPAFSWGGRQIREEGAFHKGEADYVGWIWLRGQMSTTKPKETTGLAIWRSLMR